MKFIQSNRWLVPSFSFSILLLCLRIAYTWELTFIFLAWNLFLATFPLYASYKLQSAPTKISQAFYAAAWLLFFPNSMYIVTDLFHLQERAGVPMWYDLLLILSTALNGVIMGFHSLFKVENWLSRFISRRLLSLAVFCLLFLCAYGIYLGRYERWNSWDIVSQPFALLLNIKGHIIHPLRNKDIWGLSTAFAVWMYFLYKYVQKISTRSRDL